ncbi:MAG: HAD family hydrolase [Vicinamibacterales bacterium]
MSGFAAVARHVATLYGVDEGQALRVLTTAMGRSQGRELDWLIARFDLPVSVTSLVRVIRGHEPVLRLTPATESTLRRLGQSWRLAVVTNGIPSIQNAKVASLGLDALVDTVVYASEHGSGEGKPEREPFLEALRRLDVDADRAIAVGDDDFADVFGATRCGLRTIQTREWRRGPMGPVSICADAVVSSLADVPAIAECMLPERVSQYAA